MTTKEAAQILKMTEQMLRELIKAGQLPFAFAVNLTGRRFRYVIVEEKLWQWLGRK